jgi:tetratricopeptide (TPR) repeat protein
MRAYQLEERGLAGLDPFGEQLLVTFSDDRFEATVLKHELAHALARSFLPRQPVWFAEGFASYLETLELTLDSVSVGLADLKRLRSAVWRPIPFTQVLATGPEIYVESDPTLQAAFYGRAWLLFHLLANEHWRGLEDLIDRLARAEDPRRSFAAAFPGLTPEKLEQEAAVYVNGGAYITRRYPLPPTESPLAVRALSTAEVRIAEAQLLLLAANRRPQARQAASEAAATAWSAAPGDPLAVAIWAEVSSSSAVQVADAAREATRLRPGDWRAWLLLASASGAGTGERRAAALEAARLAPEEPRVLVGLARAKLVDGGLDEALAAAREADRRSPGRIDAQLALTEVQAARGECPAAIQAGERAVELLPERTPPAAVERLASRVRELTAACTGGVRPR